MTGIEHQVSQGMEGLARAALRLVHPSITDPDRRSKHSRFLRVAFALPFLVPLTAMTTRGADAASVLAWTCIAVAVSWGSALAVMAFGRLAAASAALAFAFAAVLATTLSLGATAASPQLLLFAAIPIEAWWVLRDARTVRLGSFIALSAAIAALANGVTGTVTYLDWLAPLAWAATLWPRRSAFMVRDGSMTEIAPFAELAGGSFIRFDDTGTVLEVTGDTFGQLGLEPSALVGSGLFERLNVADRVDYMRALSNTRAGSFRAMIAVRLRAPAATQSDDSGYLDLDLEVLTDREGATYGWLRRKQVQVSAPAAEDADRLEVAKARFLAAVSHELRTPLNAIIGFSDILLHGLFGPFADPRQREYVALISESGGHLLNVVNAILDVSKIEAGAYSIRPEPFLWADAVDMSVQMIARQAEARGIAVSIDDESGGDEIVGDRRAIQQILINLLSNAVKFTQEGGKVVVSAHRRPGVFEFAVSDNGIGIAEADLSRLGKPFTQIENDLSRSFDGAGLGLSLVKGLVELHHGSMAIESALGQGTTVRIGLPDAGPRGATGAETKPEIEHEAQRKFG